MIPDALYQALIHSRALGRVLHTERQVSLPSLDFAYRTQPIPFDTGKVFAQIMC